MQPASGLLRTIARPFRWVWSHKRKTAGYSSALLVSVYASIFALVSCATSPTGQTASLSTGGTVAYLTDDQDTGVPGSVVLVHGSPADASSWNKLLTQTRDDLPTHVVVIDRLGFGNSTPGTHGSLADQAAAIEPFLQPVNGQRPILVGHSYGGPVVLRAAVDYPDRVGGIILVAGACDAYMNDAQWFRRSVDFISLVVPEPWEVSNAELLALTDENRAMESMLDRVVCPVVIIHGTWDAVCPHDATVAYLESRLANAAKVQTVSLERTGHNIHLSNPAVIAEHIRRLSEGEAEHAGHAD
ncbi:MAG: alpha/beta fold hydrolase [Phycisphaerales bacterium JB063]